MKKTDCWKQMFWLWTKKTSAQKLFYEFLQQNLTNNHNQLKFEYLNHSDSHDLYYISKQWNEVTEYSHHQNFYILWVRKWIILRLSYFSESSIKKWEEINFLDTNNNFFVISSEIQSLSK